MRSATSTKTAPGSPAACPPKPRRAKAGAPRALGPWTGQSPSLHWAARCGVRPSPSTAGLQTCTQTCTGAVLQLWRAAVLTAPAPGSPAACPPKPRRVKAGAPRAARVARAWRRMCNAVPQYRFHRASRDPLNALISDNREQSPRALLRRPLAQGPWGALPVGPRIPVLGRRAARSSPTDSAAPKERLHMLFCLTGLCYNWPNIPGPAPAFRLGAGGGGLVRAQAPVPKGSSAYARRSALRRLTTRTVSGHRRPASDTKLTYAKEQRHVQV